MPPRPQPLPMPAQPRWPRPAAAAGPRPAAPRPARRPGVGQRFVGFGLPGGEQVPQTLTQAAKITAAAGQQAQQAVLLAGAGPQTAAAFQPLGQALQQVGPVLGLTLVLGVGLVEHVLGRTPLAGHQRPHQIFLRASLVAQHGGHALQQRACRLRQRRLHHAAFGGIGAGVVLGRGFHLVQRQPAQCGLGHLHRRGRRGGQVGGSVRHVHR